MDSMMMASGPPETMATRCYRNLIAELHLMLQAMRRGQMPEPISTDADMVPHMLREAADRLDGVRS